MKFKKISRQDLSDAAARIINKPPATVKDTFYKSPEWKKIEDDYIKENPLCELCLNEGRENKSWHVHHIAPLIQGGEPFLEDNLIALCRSCHSGIHASGGICVELDVMNPLSSFDSLNNFTTELEEINEIILSQCNVGDSLNLIRERKPEDVNYVRVTTKSDKHLGKINPSDVGNYSLAFDMDYDAEVSASIKQIYTSKKGNLKCIIEISKGEPDWGKYDRLLAKDREAKEIIFQAKSLEKNNIEESILLYMKAIEMLKEIDQTFGNHLRYQRFPINRLALSLERQKRFKECLEVIESYERLTDEIGLYAGEKEKLEKRKKKIIKIIKSCQQSASGDRAGLPRSP
ncbi:MAG: HNH endonuclease [Nitrospirae bacterium]|nr:HNH endonuclease [Nitrospirota bacterium]